jgi:hypothetical protein
MAISIKLSIGVPSIGVAMFPPMLSPFLDESNELSPPSVSDDADIGTLAVSAAAAKVLGFVRGQGLMSTSSPSDLVA